MSQNELGAEPQGTPGPIVVSACAVLFLLVLAITLGAAVLVPKRLQREQAATRTACALSLRTIGLAAIQYADDRGAFPHVRGASELDGDTTTADTPKVFRALLTGGYLDVPETLLCPAAKARPRSSKEVRAVQRRWLTSAPGTAGPSPTLERCEEISYGWTRRGLPRDARSGALLAADKAVLLRGGSEPRVRGNHPDGWNALQVDGSVRWLAVDDEPFPGGWLSAAQDPQRDGFLCIAPQKDRSALR